MKTMLPSYFIFSRTNSIYQEPTRRIITNRQIFIFAIIFQVLTFSTCLYYLKNNDKLNKRTRQIFDYIILLEIAVFVFIAFIPIHTENNYQQQTQDYNNHGFRITNTNLIALPARLTYDKSDQLIVKALLVDQSKKVKRHKFAIYVNLNFKETGPKPDPLVKNDFFMANATYLGTMDQGKFKPNSNEAGMTFANYQKYIKQHHLEQHFKKHMSFINSRKYCTLDYQPSLVLIGDHNYTLHLKGTKAINKQLANNKIVVN